MHTIGLVLHPERDSAEAVTAVLDWAARKGAQVLGMEGEIRRLNCAAIPVTAEELVKRSDLVVSLGGDGTMLRAMRLADGHRAPVLGVNLGKLGFLAEVDVPELPGALSTIDATSSRSSRGWRWTPSSVTRSSPAFTDIATVRFPGLPTAVVAVRAAGHPFVSFARRRGGGRPPRPARPPTASPRGGPIVSPAVEALLVTPAAPHSGYDRGLVLSLQDSLTLEILPTSGRLAVEGRWAGGRER